MQENLEQLYRFLFETFDGVLILVVAGIILSVLICIFLELKTKHKSYKIATKETDETKDI